MMKNSLVRHSPGVTTGFIDDNQLFYYFASDIIVAAFAKVHHDHQFLTIFLLFVDRVYTIINALKLAIAATHNQKNNR